MDLRLPSGPGPASHPCRLADLLRTALAYEGAAFEADEPVSGADLVDWFIAWRREAQAALAETPIRPGTE